MLNNAQARILLILDYLHRKTNEQHPATAAELMEHLKEHGIDVARKTIYADIGTLCGLGVDIVTVKTTQNRYFIGSRLFQFPELKMLVDAVDSSKIISKSKTIELIGKLCRLTDEETAEIIHKLTYVQNRVKPENEQVYYLVDHIQTAIAAQKQITFQYTEYTPQKEKILKHDGEFYILDPYALEWKNDHYYLIGYSHKHQKIAHFRVDRLCHSSVSETSFERNCNFNPAEYVNKIVDMYPADKIQKVSLLCENDLMRVIIDIYGENVQTEIVDSKHFMAHIEVSASPTFYSWVFKFAGGIQITSPAGCIMEMREIAKKYI